MIKRKNWIFDKPVGVLIGNLRRNRGEKFIPLQSSRSYKILSKEKYNGYRNGTSLL